MPREEDSHIQRKQVEQAPPLQTKENLLARFELGSDQTNLVNAGAAHDIDGAGDVHEHYIVVAFDKSYFLGALFEDLLHARAKTIPRSEEHTSELQSRLHLVCRLLLEKTKQMIH